MYKLKVLVVLLITVNVFSQKETSAKDMDRHQEGAKQTVIDFFEGFHKGDTIMMKKTMDNDMVLRTIAKTKEGEVKTFKTEVAKFVMAIHNRPAEQKWYEKILGYTINANDRIAQVWTPYEFYVNDNFSHCGVNTFQLFNDGTSWKIISIADTRKREGCN
ncbi:nuclear transport factor 2 family protein [Aquimarina sp. 2201CG5-10]|uniref:nuclear transport factor 2 family protein n=1 Tax=Aquimarina callyspongiae TaxID=3098150 RepID=UPI002AB5D766|nr:nuclear transport factor 2 family protein [Aquimarina sp. 2201CG5-10]MDY8138930.1 nuclear transport factor 2 family protein [Aquimarina sp. 2201CG5-10]